MVKMTMKVVTLLLLGLITMVSGLIQVESPSPIPSNEEGYDKMVPLSGGEAHFHWKDDFTSGIFEGRLTLSVNSRSELPSWLGLGSFGGPMAESKVTTDSHSALIASVRPTFNLSVRHVDRIVPWSVNSASNELSYTGFTQRYDAKFRNYKTAISFTSNLSRASLDDLPILKSGTNTFWWGSSEFDGVKQPTKLGFFTLDFGTSSSDSGSATGKSTGSPPASSGPSKLKNEWLDAHNTRRKAFFTSHGKPDSPLRWSEDLAQSAQTYAEQLASIPDGCHIMHGYNNNKYGGENLYARSRRPTTAALPTPEDALLSWFEGEENDEFPASGHRTQVAWWSTNYVGCGQADKIFHRNGHDWKCQISVCRYIKPGNCLYRGWNEDPAFDIEKWQLNPNNGCGPACPAEGCF